MITPEQLPPRRHLRAFRHEGPYAASLVHPDGQRLIAARADGSVTVWSLADGRLLHHLTASLSALQLEESRNLHLRLHPDGVRLFATVVITDCSDVCFCWDLDRGQLLETYDYPQVPRRFLGDDLALSPHGLGLALWSLATMKPRWELWRQDLSWHLLDLRVADSTTTTTTTTTNATAGATLLVQGRVTLELWDLERQALRWSISGSRFGAEDAAQRSVPHLGGAAFLPDGHVLLSVAGALEVRSSDDAALLRSSPCELVGALTLDRAGRLAVIAGPSEPRPDAAPEEPGQPAERARLLAVDLQTGAVCSRFEISDVQSVQLSDDGRLALVSSIWMGWAVWELATGACRFRSVDETALVPGSDTAVTLEGFLLRRWPLGDASREVVATARRPPRPLYPVTCPAGRVTIDSLAGKLQLRRADDSSIIALATRSSYPWVLALEPDARRLALRVDDTIELWRGVAPPMRLHTFRSISPAHCGAFEPTRRWLVSGHHDGSLHLWDLEARKRAALVETGEVPLVELAISPAADRLVVLRADHSLRGYRLADLALLAEWTSEAELHDVRWLDDETLVTRCEDGDLRLRWPAAGPPR